MEEAAFKQGNIGKKNIKKEKKEKDAQKEKEANNEGPKTAFEKVQQESSNKKDQEKKSKQRREAKEAKSNAKGSQKTAGPEELVKTLRDIKCPGADCRVLLAPIVKQVSCNDSREGTHANRAGNISCKVSKVNSVSRDACGGHAVDELLAMHS